MISRVLKLKAVGVTIVAITFAMCMILVIGRSANNGVAYGTIEANDDAEPFNLDGIQADWWPKNESARQGNSDSPRLNRLENSDRVVGFDERKFFAVRRYGNSDNSEKFTRHLELVAGGQYQGYIYFHNSSKDSGPNSMSEGTRVSLSLPRAVGVRQTASAQVFSANSSPSEVGSSVVLSSPPGSYVSLQVTSAQVKVRNSDIMYPLSLTELTTPLGAAIGCEHPDGRLIADDNCWGQVLFTFVAVKNSFRLRGSASIGQKDAFANYVTISEKTKSFVIAVQYQNTGDTLQENVRLGGLASDTPEIFSVVSPTYSLQLGRQQWQSAEVDQDRFVNISAVKPGETISLAVELRIIDWFKFCKRGDVQPYLSAWPYGFYRHQVSVAVYPEKGKC
ncbi:hypothetical protein [Mycobacteroides abscessus]|uniref:hypothetical protein n=1 Tax=Mycobacteroides abscessus TaxID=36809 RepID=UPI0011C49B30|nr:hypothetical protein [Mycobacteroides abscessus]